MPANTIRILHVDNDPDQLRFSKLFLEQANPVLRIEGASSSKEALRMLLRQPYDCILSDYAMPGLNGIDLAQKVRETRRIPFIVYTGHGSEEVAEAAFASGVDDYVRKEPDPSHYQILAKRIVNAVEKHRAEELYRSVAEGSRDAIIIIVGTTYAYANRATADLMGVGDPSELVGRDCLEQVEGEDRELVRQRTLSRQTGEPQPSLYEFNLKHADGTLRRMEASVSLINYEGRPASLSFARDITDRKRMEQALSEAVERFRGIAERSIDAIFTMDLKGDFTYISPSAKRIVGYGVEEILGKNFSEFLPEPKVQEAIQTFGELLLRGKNVEGFNVDMMRKDGGIVSVEINASPIVNDGGVVGIQGIVRDVTERRRMEDKLREYAENLERMVEERTNELMDAERMVAVGAIAAMVGHDMKGPLQAIKNAVYLLRREPTIKEEMLETIEASADRAAAMLEELYHQTRDAPLKKGTVDLTSIIKAALREAATPSFIEAQLELDAGLENIVMDPIKVRRVLDNLIRNALESMPGSGALAIAAKREGDEISIRVSDTGVGIPPSEVPKLFKPFYTTKAHGTGLGLAYCKRAVEEHGGTITIDSKVGEGTTFTILLPTGQPKLDHSDGDLGESPQPEIGSKGATRSLGK